MPENKYKFELLKGNFSLHLTRCGDSDHFKLAESVYMTADNIQIIAINERTGRTVGRIQGHTHTNINGNLLWYISTFSFVSRYHRKNGVAIGMWCTLIEELKPDEIKVNVVSIGGYMLQKRLKRLYPTIPFHVCDSRNLKSTKPRKRKAA